MKKTLLPFFLSLSVNLAFAMERTSDDNNQNTLTVQDLKQLVIAKITAGTTTEKELIPFLLKDLEALDVLTTAQLAEQLEQAEQDLAQLKQKVFRKLLGNAVNTQRQADAQKSLVPYNTLEKLHIAKEKELERKRIKKLIAELGPVDFSE